MSAADRISIVTLYDDFFNNWAPLDGRGLWAGPQGERDCLQKEAGARSGAHTRTKIRVKLEFYCAFCITLDILLFANDKFVVQKVE